MAQNIPGKLTVANDVIADMAGYAALESYGVVGMADPTLRDGIAKNDEGKICAALYIVVEHGTNLAEVSRMLAEKVAYVLQDSAQLPVESVDIHVQGVKIRD